MKRTIDIMTAARAELGALKGGKEVPFSALAYGTPMSSLVERKPAQ